MKLILAIVAALVITDATAQVVVSPYQDPFFRTFPEMQRDDMRRKEAERLIDYQLQQQERMQRRLDFERESDLRRERLRNGGW